jgi:hypothetical protein
MRLAREFPDLYRYACVELKPKRLLFFLTIASIIGVTALITSQLNPARQPADHSFLLMMFLQTFILMVVGTGSIYGSIYGEKISGTWDLQRMTPLSSLEIVIGKLAGAPLMAYVICIALVPWSLIAAILDGTKISEIMYLYFVLAVAVFFTFSIGLLASAYSETAKFGSKFSVNSGFGALIGIVILMFGFGPIVSTQTSTADFYGFRMSDGTLILGAGIFFGTWALLAAKWRIGSDLCERGRVWRLPLFQVMTAVFLAGITDLPFYDRVLLLPVYGTILLEPTGESWWKWRRSMRGRGGMDWKDLPVWLAGYIGAIAAFIAYTAIQVWRVPSNSKDFLLILPSMLFVARDLAIVLAMKIRGGRLPETGAVIVLLLIYIVPSILSATTDLSFLSNFFIPFPRSTDIDFSWPIASLSGMVQLALVLFYLRKCEDPKSVG